MSTLQKAVDKLQQPFELFTSEGLKYVESRIEGRFRVVCPVTKEHDELWLKVKLVPNGSGDFVEYVSFYAWLTSLEQQQLGIEGSCDLIFREIDRLCSPTRLKVKVQTGYKAINQIAIRSNTHNYLKQE